MSRHAQVLLARVGDFGFGKKYPSLQEVPINKKLFFYAFMVQLWLQTLSRISQIWWKKIIPISKPNIAFLQCVLYCEKWQIGSCRPLCDGSSHFTLVAGNKKGFIPFSATRTASMRPLSASLKTKQYISKVWLWTCKDLARQKEPIKDSEKEYWSQTSSSSKTLMEV